VPLAKNINNKHNWVLSNSGLSNERASYLMQVTEDLYNIVQQRARTHTHTHTPIYLTALCPGLPGWAGTRKVKPIWILLKQETVSGSGIRWAICKSAPRSKQTTMPAPHHSSFFTGWMPFLLPNQQRQSIQQHTNWKRNQNLHLFKIQFLSICWCGCLSEARCRLAYGPSDATATHCLLL